MFDSFGSAAISFRIMLSISAVRTGDLHLFNQTLKNFSPKFQQDGTYTLIIRLHHNVIKTGVRMISLSYSRISLTDVAKKLQLESPEDAEFIVAKVLDERNRKKCCRPLSD